MKQTQIPDGLESRIQSVVKTAGMLFQPHPQYDGWRTTRPGFRPGEVAAFVHDVDGLRKSFISVVFHREGEEDEDGYEWGSDCYEIIVSHGEGYCDYDTAFGLDDAAEIVAKTMVQISEN